MSASKRQRSAYVGSKLLSFARKMERIHDTMSGVKEEQREDHWKGAKAHSENEVGRTWTY